MGSSFFKNKSGPINGGGNPGLLARSIGASASSAKGAGIGAQKALGAAQAINKAAFNHGPLKRSAAYPAGPKL